MLSLDGFSNLRLVTFGCPQIGDAGWRSAFQAALGSSTSAWWNMQVRASALHELPWLLDCTTAFAASA
jgi:hypothetical protein